MDFDIGDARRVGGGSLGMAGGWWITLTRLSD